MDKPTKLECTYSQYSFSPATLLTKTRSVPMVMILATASSISASRAASHLVLVDDEDDELADAFALSAKCVLDAQQSSTNVKTRIFVLENIFEIVQLGFANLFGGVVERSRDEGSFKVA